jgi:tetratricopeptide (TPR) repeat protein
MGNIDLGVLLSSTYLFDDQHILQHVLKASRLLKQVLALTTDSSHRATILYSLANNFRSRGAFREALHYYLQAGRAAQGYLNKNYWWAEAAGCLFELGKYRYAESFYRKALLLPGGENAFNQVLLADTLFHQGYFYQAATQLDEYLTQFPPTAYAVLLYHLSSALAAQVGDQSRDATGAAQLYFAPWGSATSVANLPPERAEQALRLDPLFEPAYFTLGVQAAQRGENREAAWYFLFAAFLNQQDIAAWTNACILFIGQTDAETVLSVETATFARAYAVHGAALEAEFYKPALSSGIHPRKAAESAKALVDLARKCDALYPLPSATFFRAPNLQQPGDNDGFWLSKESIPDIL